MKRRLLVNGNKHLADIIYFVDTRGRAHLKFSMKNKVSPVHFFRNHRGSVETLDLTKPHSTKFVDGGSSLEVSYKFEDSKLEVKQEVASGSVERSFYAVPVPMEKNLFSVVFQNLDILDVVNGDDKESIVIPNLGERLAFVFSFEGKDGKPMTNPLLSPVGGLVYEIVLPKNTAGFDKLHFYAVKTDTEIKGPLDFLVGIPHKQIKT